MSEVGGWIERYGGDAVPVAELLCDHHDPARIGLLYEGAGGDVQLTYGSLRDRSARLAGSLQDLGVGPGDRVAVLLPKSPELVVTLLAIWRLGAIHVPLFTAFGPDAVDYRVTHSSSGVLVTDSTNVVKAPGDFGRVVCVNATSEHHDFGELVDEGKPVDARPMRGDDPFVLLYTSGTTGQPKGVEIKVRGLAFMHAYMHYGLDVRPDDRFWNIADPGWGYGLWFGVIGSLLLGQTMVLRGMPFDAGDVFDAIVRLGITNLTSAPTAYRALRAERVPEGFRKNARLRAVSSAGEPLNPELLDWSVRELGVPIHDHYGQSEAGMVLGHHHHAAVHIDPVPGSMGTPLPGYRAVVLDEHGEETPAGRAGDLAIDTEGSPLFCFSAYHHDEERTRERFPFGTRYYLTGDTATVGTDGLFRFSSRADDVILSAGYRVGPFEIESVLITHPNVLEAAVIGTPDELRGEAITAFVVTTDGEASEALANELQALVKRRLAAHMYPRHVRFLESLPRTPSGKIKRNVLRESWAKPTAT